MALITAAREPEHEIFAFSAPARGGYGGSLAVANLASLV